MIGYATSALFSLITLVLHAIGTVIFSLGMLFTGFQVASVIELGRVCFETLLNDIKSSTIGVVGIIAPEGAFQMRVKCCSFTQDRYKNFTREDIEELTQETDAKLETNRLLNLFSGNGVPNQTSSQTEGENEGSRITEVFDDPIGNVEHN